MVHKSPSDITDNNNNKISKKTSPSSSKQIKNKQAAKNQSEVLKAIISQCEQELSRAEKFERDLNDRARLLEERECMISKREESIHVTELSMRRAFEEEKQATLKDLAEREERIFNIERKLSRSSIIETTLDMNQVIELKVGGKIFFTTLVTLKSVKDTYFTSYFSDHFKPIPLKDGTYPIDRPSKHFELILNHLRGKNIKERIQELNEKTFTMS